MLGISIIPPYETYILYEVYIAPGLMAMIQLFNGMQSSLSMVYDREMGNMRTLAGEPAAALVSPVLQACCRHRRSRCCRSTPSSLIAWFWEIEPPPDRLSRRCCRR